jgi:glycosyltransferase involved in cell wall biosynthesis
MRKRGLFIFSYPLLEHETGLYLGDECYRHTIELCRHYIDEVWVVARKRGIPKVSAGHSLLNEVRAGLMLELPDFGLKGIAGWVNWLRLCFGRKLRDSLSDLMQEADFIYVEAPSVEAWRAALLARKMDRSLIMEMRGEVLLNRDYLTERFGRKGRTYAWLLARSFQTVRKEAVAGLFINQSLLQRFPVAGGHQEAICDVHLPNQLFGRPRTFNAPARRFLYVGALEKIKQVDLILRTLGKIQDRLPSDWTLEIVGDGPEMQSLIKLGEKLGIRSHLFFQGRIEGGEPLFAFYRKSDLFLIASRSESGPRTLIEAMASALPVVATRVGMAPELLDSRALVKTNDESEYGQCLGSVAMDPILMTALSEQNWQRSQDFQLSKLKTRREAFYAQAIEMSSRSKKPAERF